MRVNIMSSNRIQDNNKELEETETFCYIGGGINKSWDIKEEIDIRIGIAVSAFFKNEQHLEMKKNIWNNNNKGIEKYYTCNNSASIWCWNLKNKQRDRKQTGFENRRLRQILGIKLQTRICNNKEATRTGIADTNVEIKKTRWI